MGFMDIDFDGFIWNNKLPNCSAFRGRESYFYVYFAWKWEYNERKAIQ